jgi:hypothetical protein
MLTGAADKKTVSSSGGFGRMIAGLLPSVSRIGIFIHFTLDPGTGFGCISDPGSRTVRRNSLK